MDHAIQVDRLPENFRIPAEWADRLEYDAEKHRLVHHGFMSKTEYDQLVAQTDDWPFIRQLERLFQQANGVERPRSRGILAFFARAATPRH